MKYTVGAKRRARAGRPRKDTTREPNGQPQRQSATESADDAMRPVLLARCKLMGWPPTTDNLSRARDQKLGTRLGQIHVAGWLAPWEYAALVKFGEVIARYRAALGCPPPYPRVGAKGGEVSTDTLEAWKREGSDLNAAVMRAYVVLGLSGQSVWQAVHYVLEEPEDLDPKNPGDLVDYLRAGADVLAEHFKMGKGQRDA